MGVYFLVFGLGFRQVSRENPLEFVFYLSIGVLAWRFLESSVSQATLCVPANRGLIHEINFPKAVFPVSICLARLYDFAWGLVVLLAALLILRQPLGVHVLWLPLIIAVQLALTIGLAFVVAYLGAFFADTRNIIDVALRLGFYASPIFYYATGQRGFIPPEYRAYYMLNPVACLLAAYRDCLIAAQPPNTGELGYVAAVALVALAAGFMIFSRGEGTFAKYV
jgi:ABC-type polysaccharide/polyol phosphate export permease